MLKIWLHRRRFHIHHNTATNDDHSLYKNVEKKITRNKTNNTNEKVYEKNDEKYDLSIMKEGSTDVARNLLSQGSGRSSALMLHFHISSLPDFIPSLFGCEEWLRAEMKKIVKHEVVAEIFAIWWVDVEVEVEVEIKFLALCGKLASIDNIFDFSIMN